MQIQEHVPKELARITSLLLEQRADMDSKFHGFKKDLDYVKNELLEVRKTKELQKDMSKYDPAH